MNKCIRNKAIFYLFLACAWILLVSAMFAAAPDVYAEEKQADEVKLSRNKIVFSKDKHATEYEAVIFRKYGKWNSIKKVEFSNKKIAKASIYSRDTQDDNGADITIDKALLSVEPLRYGTTTATVIDKYGDKAKIKIIVKKSYFRYHLNKADCGVLSSGEVNETASLMSTQFRVRLSGKLKKFKAIRSSDKTIAFKEPKLGTKYAVKMSAGGVSRTMTKKVRCLAAFAGIAYYEGKTWIGIFSTRPGDTVVYRANGRVFTGKTTRGNVTETNFEIDSQLSINGKHVPKKGTYFSVTVYNRYGQKLLHHRGKFTGDEYIY